MKINKKIIIATLNILFILLVVFFTYNYVVSKKNRVKNLENEILRLQTEIDSIPILKGTISLGPITEEIFKSKKTNYTLKKIKTSGLTTSKHPGSIGNTYLDYNNDKLFLATANGIFSFINFDEILLENSKLIVISSNIKSLIKDKKFYSRTAYGIKDLLIHNNKFYISYTNELKKNCYNTSILVANVNVSELMFKKFFVPKVCVKTDNKFNEYSPHQSGGKMVPYTKNKILFSIGEYRFRDHAQDNDIIFGKIISIDTLKKNYEIISMGHRNPQGLLYDEDQNIILSTEHGPAGGDEINVNLNPGDKVENFGWAIASYGEHYKYPGIGNRTGYDVLKVGEKDRDNPKYKKWPLYKSHKNYGFIEPIKYFTPSIAISEIIFIDPKFNGVKEKQIFVGSMGDSVEEGDLSLHYFTLSNEFKIIEHDIFQIKERIRDIVYIETLNKIFLFLENSASIGVLEARN